MPVEASQTNEDPVHDYGHVRLMVITTLLSPELTSGTLANEMAAEYGQLIRIAPAPLS